MEVVNVTGSKYVLPARLRQINIRASVNSDVLVYTENGFPINGLNTLTIPKGRFAVLTKTANSYLITDGDFGVNGIPISKVLNLQTTLDTLSSSIDSKVPLTRNLTIDGTTYDLSEDREWVIAGSGVPTTRELTINGTSYDLSADRTWSVGTVTSVGLTAGTGINISGSPITSSGNITVTNSAPDQTVALTAGTGISVSGTYPNFTITNTSSGGTVTSVGALTLGTSGTDLSSTVANSTTTPVITLNVPTASASNRGALSSTDWSTFNSKEPAITWAQGDILYGTGINTYTKLPKSTTAGQFLSNSGTSNNPAWDTPLGYTINFSAGGGNPADATTYYLGSTVNVTVVSATTGGLRRMYIPKDGIIDSVYGTIFNTVYGTSETSSIYIRVNNTTDTLITNSLINNAQVTSFSGTGLGIAVTAGQYIELKWITPTWVTNPATISIWGTIYII